MSALLPMDTNADRPIPRDTLASRSASPSAPLCEENPMFPGTGDREANVAFSRTAVDEIPRQFGPSNRAPCARTRARRSRWRSSPSEPTSANPAEITQIARMPTSSADRTASRTASAGTHTTARSTSSGTSPMEPYPRTPATGSALRLTGYAAPAYSPARMLRKSSPPIVPSAGGRAQNGDAPRLEERTERCDDRTVITFLHARRVVGRRSDRERHLDLTALERP